jgi:glycosyltransferase involved in cell wall biosynthesis
MTRLKILALEPYYGGSHRAFLDGWIAASGHRWTLLTLPAYQWKWRMRHAPLSFASELERPVIADQGPWDVLFATDMLDLAQLAGLAPTAVAALPRVVYFHENQLTYPVRHEDPRDLHFAFTNVVTALAADRVWFNSVFHRAAFLGAAEELLRELPDLGLGRGIDGSEVGGGGVAEVMARIGERSAVETPGIDPPPRRPEPRAVGPLRLVWAARWEHDKNPEAFFSALELVRQRGVDFQVSVLGESFREVPGVFQRARQSLGQRVRHWGYAEERAVYWQELTAADVFVSTAGHEFFGLGAVEAMAAGAFPLLPRRLAYPELLAPLSLVEQEEHLFGGEPEELADRIEELATRLDRTGSVWREPGSVAQAMGRYFWRRRAPELDQSLNRIVDELRKPSPRR